HQTFDAVVVVPLPVASRRIPPVVGAVLAAGVIFDVQLAVRHEVAVLARVVDPDVRVVARRFGAPVFAITGWGNDGSGAVSGGRLGECHEHEDGSGHVEHSEEEHMEAGVGSCGSCCTHGCDLSWLSSSDRRGWRVDSNTPNAWGIYVPYGPPHPANAKLLYKTLA